MAKIPCAGTAGRSFAEAGALLERSADLPTPEKQVERVTRRIGAERAAEREAAVAAFAALPLAAKFGAPAGVTPPDSAVVMAGGGRLQIRDGPGAEATPAASDAAPPAAGGTADAEAQGWGEAEAACRSGHWREDKVGLLLTMTSEATAADPCPDIPASFLDVVRIPKSVRGLSRHVKEGENGVAETAEPEAAAGAMREEAKYRPPEVRRRQVVASRRARPAFALPLAQMAWAPGFQRAARKAFLGGGPANNWTLRRRFFGSFTAILGFIHALPYVFAAAMAGRRFAAGWAVYRQWIGRVWQGRVTEVIVAPGARQAELGEPAGGGPGMSPRRVVAKTLTYPRNHRDKMRYDEYRRQGLPITGGHVGSVVKQINQRVKGTGKFWSEDGSEAVPQLRADYLSDGQPRDASWRRRQEAATGQRSYRRLG